MGNEIVQAGEEVETSDKLVFEPVRPFPMAMFDFRRYDAVKFFAAIVFFLGSLYLVNGVLSLMFEKPPWWSHIWIVGWFFDTTLNIARFTARFVIFSICYLLAWLAFEPRSFKAYATSALTAVFGIVYMLAPLDIIPDALPGLGTLDDATVGLGSIFIAIKSWMAARQREEISAEVAEMANEGRYREAVKKLLRSEGYRVGKTGESPRLPTSSQSQPVEDTP